MLCQVASISWLEQMNLPTEVYGIHSQDNIQRHIPEQQTADWVTPATATISSKMQ